MQASAYQDLKALLSHHNFIDIDANQTPDQVVNDIEQNIIRQMAFMTMEKRKKLNLS